MKRNFEIFLSTAVICASLVISARAAQLATTSLAGSNYLSAGGNSFGPVFSADGTRVVFVSHAGNLVTNETLRESLQVFVRDLATSNTVLVSVSTNASGGNANSFGPMLSSNGQFVVFASEASDLVSGDTNNASDVFVRNLSSGVTRLVSAEISGNAPANDQPASVEPLSGNPIISADGRWVFFESRATNLTQYLGSGSADTNGTMDVFGRDLATGSNFLVSVNRVDNRAANGRSVLADITPDATRVAFISTATDLAAPAGNVLGDVYVRDLATRITYRVSASISDSAANYRWLDAALSADGQFVAVTMATSTAGTSLFRIEVETGTSILIATNIIPKLRSQISANGRYLTFEDGTNAFRYDANTGTNELVNVTTADAAPASGIARNPVAAPDGNGIVFISNCPDLATNGSLLFQIYARDMAAGSTRLITVATSGGPSTTNNEVSLLAVAPDFSRVAFDTTATDLVNGDGNRASDVFVRDLAEETTTLISIRDDALPRQSGVAHAFISRDCVSADGRFIAFTSYDGDLLPDDSNLRPDVFVRDTVSGIISTPGVSTNAARSPAISVNGRYVAYLRRSFTLASDTSGGAVWRFDRESGTNELVSSSSQRDPAISADGNLVAFIWGNNLVVRDMALQTNYIVAPADSSANRQPVFTPDGRFVLFSGAAPSFALYAWDSVLQQTQAISGVVVRSAAISGNSRFVAFSIDSGLYVADLITRTNQLLRPPVGDLAISGDGTLIVFVSNGFSLLAFDRITGRSESVVTEPGGPFNAPLISPDERFVVYAREWMVDPTHPSPFNVDYTARLYVRDRKLGTTTLLSTGLAGNNANASVWQPVLAVDGRTVVFHSVASDLVAGDYNDKSDVFVLKLGGADTDGDGMDDDWEVAYFGSLSRDGSGDFDGDGATDLQEFLAGTDPTNSDSVFRVLTVTPLGGDSTRVLWTGNPTRNYRVEYKDNVTATSWVALDGTVSWTDSTASLMDSGASPNRYYRVVRLP